MTKMNLETAARAGSVAHMIRGGRLVKRKGQVLSFAPHVGQLCSVSCGALAAGLALGVSLLGAAPASAGTCDPLLPPQDPNGSIVTCSAQADPVNDVTVVIKGEQLTINTSPGFGVSTSAGDGLNIETTTGIEFGLIFSDNEASQITAAAGTALAINAVGKSTGSITGLQMGLDFVRNVKADGSATFVGAYSGYADGSSSDKNIFQGVSRKSGTSDSKGWLAGLYGTHYASAGWYANVVLQANWVDASANGRNGTVLKTDGRTYLSSLELGQSLKLADRLAFEPQVQLIYGDTQFDAATDSSGIESRVGIESSLIGRAGFRLKTTKNEKYNAEGGLFSGYLKANLWHNLSGADIELFSADQAIGGFEPKKTWVDVGLGTTLTVAKNTEIYFDADVEFGLDKKNTAGRGNVGLRFNW